MAPDAFLCLIRQENWVLTAWRGAVLFCHAVVVSQSMHQIRRSIHFTIECMMTNRNGAYSCHSVFVRVSLFPYFPENSISFAKNG